MATDGLMHSSGRIVTRKQVQKLERENRQWPDALTRLPDASWPPGAPSNLLEAWRSRGFLLQVFAEANGVERLSFSRTSLNDAGRWDDRIQWDDLQRLKTECGRGDRVAVEVYPANADVVNVANMRHLWVLPEAPPFVWRKQDC